MQRKANFAVGSVAFIHILISIMEMILWPLPFVYERLDRFHFSPEEARTIWPIVANAGLYNSFIAAGLVWSLYTTRDSQSIKVFFLTCVVIAGIVGAPTVSWLTIVIQTLPALLALLLLRVSNKET